MVIRHPFLSFSLPTPMTERERHPLSLPFPFPFPHSFLYLYPGSVRLSLLLPFPATFSFPLSVSISISVSFFLFSPQPSFPSTPLLLQLALLCQVFSLQGAFYVFPGLSTRRLFSDLSFSRLPSSRRRRTNQLFLRENASGNDHPATLPFHPCSFAIPVSFRVLRRETKIF